MNHLPIEIIKNEILPRLELSSIVHLLMLNSTWNQIAKEYIINIGKKLKLLNICTYLDVIKILEYDMNIRQEFIRIKYFIPIIIQSIMRIHTSELQISEDDILDVLDLSYDSFQKDLLNLVDVISGNVIIKPWVVDFIKKNQPNEMDCRVIDKLFPNFQRKINKLKNHCFPRNIILSLNPYEQSIHLYKPFFSQINLLICCNLFPIIQYENLYF
jgi:hypothetical protein